MGSQKITTGVIIKAYDGSGLVKKHGRGHY